MVFETFPRVKQNVTTAYLRRGWLNIKTLRYFDYLGIISFDLTYYVYGINSKVKKLQCVEKVTRFVLGIRQVFFL